MTCTGTGGSAQASATVTVGSAPPAPPAPTVTLSANPANVAYNGNTTLTWSSTNATGCSAGWTSSTAASGSQGLYNLKSSQTYTMTCTGAGGSQSASVTVGSACTQKTFYKDADGDLFPVSETVTGCFAPAGYIEVTPTSPIIGPIIIYNRVVNSQWDCNDNDKTVQVPVDGYLDSDRDGYAPDNATRITCASWGSYPYIATKLGDCDDNHRGTHPGGDFGYGTTGDPGTRDGDLKWDRNCDGVITKRSTEVIYADWLNLAGLYIGYPSNCQYFSGTGGRIWGHNPRTVNVSNYSCGSGIGWVANPTSSYVDNKCSDKAYYAQAEAQLCK